ncbi:hypothetical protein [Caldimonas brevitalea]|uniref:Uncharacterized protein n=1 Tax=Caldimonas brevitalea TaxID=413882 RepID=A0A0G3BUZ7_9BURK|nr:hypothetical protein [Caldimonas brevitalea]AKJ31216.1 hypothetical protein AAW51_4525 [Caldimonas brevitalea]
MPFVARNFHGVVVSLHLEPTPHTQEFLPDNHPDVEAFVGRKPPAPRSEDRFQALDADFVRVLEDVIDLLIARNLIRITDLPPEAQQKLFSRKSFRDNRNRNSLKLFDPAALDAVTHLPPVADGEPPPATGLDVIDTDFHDDLGR